MTSKVHLFLALVIGEFDLKQYGLHTMEDTEAPEGDLPACRPSAGRASLRCSSRGRSCSRCCSGTSPRTSSPWAVSWPGRSPGPPGRRAATAVAGGALSGIGSSVHCLSSWWLRRAKGKLHSAKSSEASYPVITVETILDAWQNLSMLSYFN